MKTNKILQTIQEALGLSSADISKAYELAECNIDALHINDLLNNVTECSFEELGSFLDGLIILKRGLSLQKNNNDEIVELNNNLILKKLRIALELKEAEMEIIFGLGEVQLSKQQLSSLFRKEGHKNFKTCSDELLTSFLEGLDEFYYVDEEK